MLTWATALLPWLALPFSGAAVLGLLRYVSPTARWTRQIRNDQAIYADLPDGEVKQRLGTTIEQQTADLLDYRELMPTRMKVEHFFGVLFVVGTVGMVVVMGPKAFIDSVMYDGPQGLFVMLGSLPLPILFAIRAVRGHPVGGMSIRDYLESERVREAAMVEQYRTARAEKAAKKITA